MKLSNKVAVITGASRGIGKSIALRFAEEGANLAICARNEDRLKATVKEIKDLYSVKVIGVKTNVSERSDVEHFVGEALDSFGYIDILVNNAGVGIRSPFLEMTDDIWDKTISINLKGTFLCSQIVAKIMVEQKKSGKIINMSSICGVVADKFSFHAAYEVSKAGIILLTKAMALELGPYNINVNAIGPGRIKTDLTNNNPDHIAKVLTHIPLGRYGSPNDVAGAALFLASDDSNYIHGTTLIVDGGWLAH